MRVPHLIFISQSYKMPQLNNLHIIIAEDDIDDADIIRHTFNKNPDFAKVSLVANGEELINYLEDTSNETPDIILTDINMPILDGIEALQQILNNNNLKTIPCFVYSTSINPVYKEKCDLMGVKALSHKTLFYRSF